MRRHFILFLFAAVFAQAAGAEALAHSGPVGSCLAASVEAQPAGAGGQVLYRIVFLNRCETPRSLYWCAEHRAAAVPAAVACPRSQGSGAAMAAPLHWIVVRKEFQWNLPAGSRIRFLDCAGREVPTLDFACAPVPQR